AQGPWGAHLGHLRQQPHPPSNVDAGTPHSGLAAAHGDTTYTTGIQDLRVNLLTEPDEYSSMQYPYDCRPADTPQPSPTTPTSAHNQPPKRRAGRDGAGRSRTART